MDGQLLTGIYLKYVCNVARKSCNKTYINSTIVPADYCADLNEKKITTILKVINYFNESRSADPGTSGQPK